MLLSLVLLSACDPATEVNDTDKPGDSAADTADTAVEDIGEDSAGDTGGDTGVDTGEDTGEDTGGGDGEIDLAFDVEGDWDDTVFGLVQVHLGDEGYEMADIAAQATPSARIELDIAPPEDLLEAFPDVPALEYAFFAAGLHEDDGDGAWDPDEGWVGTSMQLVVYFDGVLPAELVDLGLRLGWNALRVDSLGGGAPDIVDPLELSIQAGISEDFAAEGISDGTVPDGALVAAVPYAAFAGVEVSRLLDDSTVTAGAWEVSWSGEPDESHVLDVDGNGLDEAPEVLVAFDDANGDGWPGGDETVYGAACFEGLPVLAWWMPPDPDIGVTLNLRAAGLGAGWSALTFTEEGSLALLDAGDLRSLVVSTSCVLE